MLAASAMLAIVSFVQLTRLNETAWPILGWAAVAGVWSAVLIARGVRKP
jgi:hypothetical protein